MECKSVGNLLFKQKDYAGALDKYREGVSALEQQAAEDTEAGADETTLLAQLHYNASTCLFKLNRLDETLDEVQSTLGVLPYYVKAMFRCVVCTRAACVWVATRGAA
jgi:tetratricopeptide (TPR) repeat protein